MNFINATINETNKIEKKCFNLTEENITEIITLNNNKEELSLNGNGSIFHKDCNKYKNF
jgi:hypothetical protein